MKLATLNDGSRDGKLVVVSKDITRYCAADNISPTLQAALDDWANIAPRLEAPLRTVQRGTFYRLWTAESDPAALEATAVQVAVSRTRRQGLLMNPHAQTLEVLRVWSNSGLEGQRT